MTPGDRTRLTVASVVTAGLLGFLVGQATATPAPSPTPVAAARASLAPSPEPTPTVKAKPRPTATPAPQPKPKPSRASRSETRHAVGKLNYPDPSVLPAWVHSFRKCVLSKESANWPYDGNPRPYEAVRSDGGTASGAYQFINSSWRDYSREAGHPGWSRAYLAPPRVQDDVFYWVVMNKGRYPWKGNGCV